MRQRNIILSAVALSLLAISIVAYHYTESRGERFERGRKLLPNLNPGEVAAIRITEGPPGEGAETLNLERRGDSFRIVERDGYAAKNEAVNRLLKALLEVSLEKEVGSGPKLAEELGIEPPGPDTLDVLLEDSKGKAMVHLRLGQEFEGGGVYVKRLDGEAGAIYLTSSRPYLDTAPEDFLKREVVDVTESAITRIEGPDFVVEEVFEDPPPTIADLVEPPAPAEGEEGAGGEAATAVPPPPAEPVSLGLRLADLPAGAEESTSGMNKLKGALSRLEFEEVFPADSPEVADLAFEQRLTVYLDDTSGYVLSLAERDDTHYLRIEGFSTVGQVQITRDESEEELKEKADALSRSDEIRDFNSFHGSWIYQIADRFAEKISLTRDDLVE